MLRRTAVVTCAVVMATFNGQEYLPEQLRSILQQTRSPDEMFISDDGSSDRTLEQVEAFARRAPFPVHVLHGPRAGYAENFWSAAKRTGSDTVAWADQDDVWYPTKLAVALDALSAGGTDLVTHSARVVGPNLRPNGRMLPSYVATRTLDALSGDGLHVASGFASVVRKSLLSEVRWSDRPVSHQHGHLLGHDHAVALMAFAGHRRTQLSDVLADYRQHGGNVAGDPREGRIRQVLTGLRTEPHRYDLLADRVEGYATWLRASGWTQADDYFRRLAERIKLRSEVRSSPRTATGLRALKGAYETGAYRSLEQAGFGPRAFGNDALTVLIGRTTPLGDRADR